MSRPEQDQWQFYDTQCRQEHDNTSVHSMWAQPSSMLTEENAILKKSRTHAYIKTIITDLHKKGNVIFQIKAI